VATLFFENFWVPNFWGAYVAYCRESSARRSGLDLSNQREAIARILDNGKCRLIGEFVEQEPLPGGERPMLKEAIVLCQEKKAKLIIGKVGRLHRDISFLETMQKSDIKFIAADLPQCNHLHAWHFVREELERRKRISLRVQEGLAKAKQSGVVLGSYAGTRHVLRLGPAASAVSRRYAAIGRAEAVMRHIEWIRDRFGGDLSLRNIAGKLNEFGIKAPRGGKWSAAQVRAVILRCRQTEVED
jgi:DNA invertase Pin-like site-specific DNA recombinase